MAGKTTEKPTGLDLLREPFPENLISKLPKPTKRQTEEVRADFKKGIRCHLCGQWHHPQVQHLDYVGHAALTDRLLDCDPAWNWEPLAFAENGTPLMDENGGMWIRLTVCGQSRLGYGHPDGKRGGDAIKEVIGDAMRNAAMRFGAALDLWHKGDLHVADQVTEGTPEQQEKKEPAQKSAKREPQQKKAAPEMTEEERTAKSVAWISEAKSMDELAARFASLKERHPSIAASEAVDDAYETARARFANADVDDEIPY